MNNDLLNKHEILARAKLSWDKKSNEEKLKAGGKYQIFMERYNVPFNDWLNNFDLLTKQQQNIVIKGELIRYYDSLPNVQKTYIMREFELSNFSSKWYKLSSADKKKLLNHIIR